MPPKPRNMASIKRCRASKHRRRTAADKMAGKSRKLKYHLGVVPATPNPLERYLAEHAGEPTRPWIESMPHARHPMVHGRRSMGHAANGSEPRKENNMVGSLIRRRLGGLALSVALFFLTGCAGPVATIRKVDSPKENELRADWRNYNTYCLADGYGVSRQGNAILFQLKGKKRIVKSSDWRQVASDPMAAGCATVLAHSSQVMQLKGENEEIFGYLIYDAMDMVSASIVDPDTIQLFYNVSRKGGR